MRLAFYGGAKALLHTMMTVFDPEAEPTQRDMDQMTAIDAELEAFAASVREEARG